MWLSVSVFEENATVCSFRTHWWVRRGLKVELDMCSWNEKTFLRILSLNLLLPLSYNAFLTFYMFCFLFLFLFSYVGGSPCCPSPSCPASSLTFASLAQCSCFSPFDCCLLTVHCGMISEHPGWMENSVFGALLWRDYLLGDYVWIER